MKYYKFLKGQKEVAPTFKSGEDTVTKLSGTLVGVYYNPEEDKINKTTGESFKANAHINIKFEDKQIQIDENKGGIFRTVCNSLLSANIGDEVELSTYINNGYKVISVSNPNEKQTVISKRTGKEVELNKSYPWAVDFKDIPEVEIIKNKKGDFVSADDSEANEFFANKIKEKFSNSEVKSAELSVDDLPEWF